MNVANFLYVLGYYNKLFSLSNLKFVFFCNLDLVFWFKICNKKDVVLLDWFNKVIEEIDREEFIIGVFF